MIRIFNGSTALSVRRVPFSLFHHSVLISLGNLVRHKLGSLHTILAKMHLSPLPVASLSTVRSKTVVLFIV